MLYRNTSKLLLFFLYLLKREALILPPLLSFFLTAKRRTPKSTAMVSNAVVSHSIFLLIFFCSSAISIPDSNQTMFPMTCSTIMKCDASLYHINNGQQTKSEIAAAYSVNPWQIQPIQRGGVQDYLITVPCSCESADGVSGTAYFHDTSFRVGTGDFLSDVSNRNYSGQVWIFGDPLLVAGEEFGVKLLCGCVEDESKIVVSYTVQSRDTLSQIASLLRADATEIHNLNAKLIEDPALIVPNWVLFVPMFKNAYQNTKGNLVILLNFELNYYNIIVSIKFNHIIIILINLIFLT